MIPFRGNVLLRMVETEEHLAGGAIVIPVQARERLASHQAEVLAVGLPEVCDDDDCERPHDFGEWEGIPHWGTENVHPIHPSIKPGAWVYVSPRSLVDAGDLIDRRYFVRADDVLGVFMED